MRSVRVNWRIFVDGLAVFFQYQNRGRTENIYIYIYIYVLANIKQQIYRDIDAYYLIHGCLQEAPLAHVEATENVFC